MSIFIGLPQWQHAAWKRIGLCDLADYSQCFNCVEGNTTFYAVPNRDTVQRWRAMTHDDFRFCFKFPAQISHIAALCHCDNEVNAFLRALTPIHTRIGQLWLQLPASFSPSALADLWSFLDSLPRDFTYGVEVRHPAFFAKGEAELELNQGLHQRGVNRVMLDSRALHHATPHSKAVIDAQRKKPKLPVHALLTAGYPLIRFIGSDIITDNFPWFTSWQKKLTQWYDKSQPYLFIHTPDNSAAPLLAGKIWQQLCLSIPTLSPAPSWPEQNNLF